MNESKILDEQRYQKTRKRLIIIGCISFLLGVGLLVTGILIDISMASKGFFFMGAFVLGLMIPLPVFGAAFSRNFMAFQVQSTMPIAKETAKEVTPIAGDFAKEVSKGIKEGLKDEEQK